MNGSKRGCFCVLLVVLTAGISFGSTTVEKLVLTGNDTESELKVQITQRSETGVTLEFELPFLEQTNVEMAGQSFQLLSIPDGAYKGADGTAALPTYTKLVAIPERAAVGFEVVDQQLTRLQDYRLLPRQPEGAETFVMDTDWYSRSSKSGTGVQVGAPALLRNIRVVPVTFSPVAYDPSTGEVEVAQRITVQLDYSGEDLRNISSTPQAAIPESFARLIDQQVVGLDRSIEVYEGPGVYALIHPDDPAVLNAVLPLIEWRERQGYHVVVASTSETGSTKEEIRDYLALIDANAPVPLEFVCLVGDANGSIAIPTWHEGVSGYGGEGDHYYTQISGTDVVPDIHIGRLSARSVAELEGIVSKIVSYESDPYLASDPDWYTRSLLAGDPSSSGWSTVWLMHVVKERMQEVGYTQIDTLFGNVSAYGMMNSINQGMTMFVYRGFYAMSGMNSGHIGALTNGRELPFAVLLTCETGSFETDINCRSEAFLRNPNGGGVAGIGTATGGTHTRYNNCVILGVCDGVLATGEYRTGPALTSGKLNLYNNYQIVEPGAVETWSVWNNLMGDPATDVFTGYPATLAVSHPASVAVGANGVTVTVESGGQPLAGVLVAVHKDDQTHDTCYTNEYGEAALYLNGPTAGEVLVTVTGHNVRPYLGSMTVGTQAQFINLGTIGFDDGSGNEGQGNADGLVNPAEILALSIALDNLGTETASGVTAVMSSPDPRVTLIESTHSYGDISAGGSGSASGPFVLEIAPDVQGKEILELRLDISSGGQTWTSLCNYMVYAPRLTVSRTTWQEANGDGDREALAMVARLFNSGNTQMPACTGTLESTSDWVTITDPTGSFDSIPVQGVASNTEDTFAIELSERCYPGHFAPFTLTMDFGDGSSAKINFSARLGGVAETTDPVGPDNYGYYAMDDTDIGYYMCPVYEWVEISPQLGGPGHQVPLTDFGNWQDDTEQVDLPFEFTYYGKSFNTISVCSNGWIAMGDTNIRSYRNWSIPCIGGPKNLIAAYWDDLYLRSSLGGVFTWYDSENHCFIIQWDRALNMSNNTNEEFEIILWDPAYYEFSTGDGLITFQYKDVMTWDVVDGYVTVGIQNEDRDDGVLYTYFDEWANGAAPLDPGRAINFVPILVTDLSTLNGTVSNLVNGVPIPDARISFVNTAVNLESDENGIFDGYVSAGSFRVAVSHESFAPDTTDVIMFEPSELVTVDFQLTDIQGPSFSETTVFSANADTIGPYVIETTLTDFSNVDQAILYYTSSTSGGPFSITMVPVDLETGVFAAGIPGQAFGSQIQYWIVAKDGQANESREPANSPLEEIYTFTVDDPIVVFNDDMETHGGWMVSGNALHGQWERCNPYGIYDGDVPVQPEHDHSPMGTHAWITENDPGPYQGPGDVDGGLTNLTSIPFDLSSYSSARVEYWRWYSNDTAGWPNQDFWRVQVSNGGSGWVDLENTNQSVHAWDYHVFEIQNYIEMGHGVQFRFIAEDLSPESIVEAGVDDFRLTVTEQILDQAAPTLILEQPRPGEVYSVPTWILWDAVDDIGIVHAEISLSTDSGVTWSHPVSSGPYNNEYFWSIPQMESSTCRLQVRVFDSAGNVTVTETPADFTISISTGVEDRLPTRMTLAQNVPNPFNPATEIRFALPHETTVELKIYSLEGKLIRTLIDQILPAGQHTVAWQGRDDRDQQVASGLYFYRLDGGGKQFTRKMMLLK